MDRHIPEVRVRELKCGLTVFSSVVIVDEEDRRKSTSVQRAKDGAYNIASAKLREIKKIVGRKKCSGKECEGVTPEITFEEVSEAKLITTIDTQKVKGSGKHQKIEERHVSIAASRWELHVNCPSLKEVQIRKIKEALAVLEFLKEHAEELSELKKKLDEKLKELEEE